MMDKNGSALHRKNNGEDTGLRRSAVSRDIQIGRVLAEFSSV